MQIKPTPIINNESNTFLVKIRMYFFAGKIKLKTLMKDVFEKSNPGAETKMTEKNLYPRELPNSVSAADEFFSKGGGEGKIHFYPEDVEKMKSMTTSERLLYGEKLIDEGRYFN